MQTTLALTLMLTALVFGSASAQETIIRGFTDVGFKASDRSGDHASFAFGEYDLFITSEITDRIRMLGETTFENEGGEFDLQVERVAVKYTWNVNLNVEIGKFHTPVGYWNEAYHHGRVFWPTTGRPLIFGGVLPIHTTGILLWGDHLGKLDFSYDILIGNGIGGTDIKDNDDVKSVTLALKANPTEEFGLGLSAYVDRISEGVTNKQGTKLVEDLDQILIAGMAVYTDDPFQFMGEFVRAMNKTSSSGTTTTNSFYGYAGYRTGKTVPYARFDRLDFDDDEPYFKPEDTTSFTFGIRYEFSYLAVMKLEFQTLDRTSVKRVNSFALQMAIGF